MVRITNRVLRQGLNKDGSLRDYPGKPNLQRDENFFKKTTIVVA